MNYSNDELAIILEPSTGILRAAWARPLLTAGLIDSYYQLLEEAVAQERCRFWHLDLRTRIWPAATFVSWFIETFAPAAVQRLGGPIYIAYWVGPGHHSLMQHPYTLEMQRRVAEVNFYPVFFEKEPDARAWLLQHQALAGDQRQVA